MRLLQNDVQKKQLKQTKPKQTKTITQNKNQGHIYMVKVSTTVFKV